MGNELHTAEKPLFYLRGGGGDITIFMFSVKLISFKYSPHHPQIKELHLLGLSTPSPMCTAKNSQFFKKPCSKADHGRFFIGSKGAGGGAQAPMGIFKMMLCVRK